MRVFKNLGILKTGFYPVGNSDELRIWES